MIQGCLDCENLTHCLDCDEDNNYYPINDTCGYCNDTLDDFIDELNCLSCEIMGCLDCANLTHCLDCDEANYYYPDGGVCSYCNITIDDFLDG